MNETKKRVRKFSFDKYYIYIITVGMIVLCGILNKNFLSWKNLVNILTQMTFTTIAAFAMTLLLISGLAQPWRWPALPRLLSIRERLP